MKNYMSGFPKEWQFDVGDSIDVAIKAFSKDHREVFTAIKSAIIGSIKGINWALSAIPLVAYDCSGYVFRLASQRQKNVQALFLVLCCFL